MALPGLSQLIEAKNGLRYPRPGDPRGGWQREWYHFCVAAPGIDLLVNLNVSGDTRPAARPGSRVARVILLARDREWSGEVETIDERNVELCPGEVGLRLGQNQLTFRGGCFELTASLQGRPLLVEARLEPLSVPLSSGREVEVGCGSINWFAIPRLAAYGRIVCGDRVHRLEGAPAYHDHNWGRWLWGHDFCWEWGFAHLDFGGENWCLIHDRTLNRPRTRTLESTLALWRDGHLWRVFSRREIIVHPRGFLDLGRILRVPRPLAMAVPKRSGDVPRCLWVEAVSGEDRVSFSFDAEDMAQILVPNETDLATTVINEVLGRAQLEAEVRGRRVAAEGKGFFEFLTS